MDWLNLHTSVLDSPEVIGAEPVDRGTWLMLERYCIGQENGGIIKDCRRWKDRKWQQVVRVTQAEVNRESDLWAWRADDLMVMFYPLEKEAEVKRLRELGKLRTPAKQAAAQANGKLGGRPVKTQQETQQETEHAGERNTQQKPDEKPIQGKGSRREEEEEGKRSEERRSASPEAIEAIRNAYPRRTHPREAVTEIEAAIKRSGNPTEILAGVKAIAAAVAGWTESERLQFLKPPPAFFAGDHWRDDPAFWASKTAARKQHAGVRPEISLDLGGRRPKAIRGIPAASAATNGNELEF